MIWNWCIALLLRSRAARRVFYLQARRGNRLVTLLAEKEQIRELANAINRLLETIGERNPRLATSDDLIVADMSLKSRSNLSSASINWA